MSVTVKEPQRGTGPEEPSTSKLMDTAKKTSEQEPGNGNNDAEVKENAESTQHNQKNGQNDKHDRGAPRIIMAYIPASAPASPAPLTAGCNTPEPEASDNERRPSTPNLTTKLSQAFNEYRARKERLGDLGHQIEDEGYEGDASSPDEHQGCCEHDHGAQEHYSHEYQQQYYDGHSPPSFNAPWGWTPYQTASSPPFYMQSSFQQQQYQQQQQYYQFDTPPLYHPHRFTSPYHSHPYYFPHPHQFPHHHQHHHFTNARPSPSTHPSGSRIRGSPPHLYPIPPYISSASPYPSSTPAFPQAHPYPHPQQLQPPHPQDPHVTDLTNRLQDIQAQLNALDAAHKVEIWRHGKYNFHRRRAKDLRKIKREKVEVMVSVVRKLRGLGISVRGRGGQYQGQQGAQGSQGQQHEEMYYMSGPGLGYDNGFQQDQGWEYELEVGQEARYGPGYGPGYGYGYGYGYGCEQPQEQQQWFGPGGGYQHGYGQAGPGSWSEVELEVGHDGHGGCCGCREDGAHVDSPRDNAFESLACEYGTTVDGEAGPESPEGESSKPSPSPSPTLDISNETGTGRIDTTAGTRPRTFSLPLDTCSMEKTSQQQVEAIDVDGHEQQHDARENVVENEQGAYTKKNTCSTRERAGSWSDAEAVISKELRGIWRQKMSE